MYMTRILSQLQRSPELLSTPPDGPNSGYLVIEDEESERETYSCFGSVKVRTYIDLPFPQNKELTYEDGDDSDPIIMIPVLNQPLSSNLYYAIHSRGNNKGESFTCSTEQDMVTCCFCTTVIDDVESRPLDPNNIYQQFEIVRASYEDIESPGYFFAKSIASDGYPPSVLRRKGWHIYTTPSTNRSKLEEEEARGVDSALRARLPELNVSQLMKSSEPVLVGKWYCPFMFVKEERVLLKDQVKKSVYYEVTLEQRWQQAFSLEKDICCPQQNSVVINALLEKEEVFISGNEGAWSVKNDGSGVIWFTGYGSGGGKSTVGLRQEVVERMIWEQERFGWVGGEEKQVKIDRVKEFKESGEWSELKGYVLVERFNFRRMDGSLVMAYDFKHCHQMKIKWI